MSTAHKIAKTTAEEMHILSLLAREWDTMGPPGVMDISDIVAAVALAPSQALTAIKTLFSRGLLDMNSLKTSAVLTPDGYAATQENPHQSEKKTDRGP